MQVMAIADVTMFRMSDPLVVSTHAKLRWLLQLLLLVHHLLPSLALGCRWLRRQHRHVHCLAR